MACGSPLCAVWLEEEFDEGEDFLLHAFTPDGLSAPQAKVVQRVLQPDVRGVLHASVSVLSSLVGQAGSVVSFSQSADSTGTTMQLLAASVCTPFVQFVVVFPDDVPAESALCVAHAFFDVVTEQAGPVTPHCASWVTGDDGGMAAVVDPVLTYLFNLCSGAVLPASVCASPWVALAMGVAPVARFRPPPAVVSAVDELLCEVEVGEVTAAQCAADGVAVCLPVGSALFHGGRLVATHLSPVEATAVVHLLARHGAFTAPDDDSAAASAALPLHAAVHPHDGTVVRCSALTVHATRPLPPDSDAACPPPAYASRRMVSYVALGRTVLCMVLCQRGVDTVAVDPYHLRVMSGVLHSARLAGTLALLTDTMSVAAVAAGPDALPAMGLTPHPTATAPDTPPPASPPHGVQLLVTGGRNHLLHFLHVDTGVAGVLQPQPRHDDAAAFPLAPVVRQAFERLTLQLHATLTAMAACAPLEPSDTLSALPSSLFSPPARIGVDGATTPAGAEALDDDTTTGWCDAGKLLMVGGGTPHAPFAATDFDPLPDDDDGGGDDDNGGASGGGGAVGAGQPAAPPAAGTGAAASGDAPLPSFGEELGAGNHRPFVHRDKTVEAAECVPGAVEAGCMLALPGTTDDFTYHVVGRLLSSTRCFYLCYEGTVGQDVLEVAFRAGFGL